jgi:MFS family permease
MKQNVWTLSSLFANACITGLSTLLPLYIIFLGGTVIDVAFSLSLFNLSLIVSALFWGYVIDSFGWRKRLIVISYLGLVVGSIALYSITNLVLIALIYGFIGFMRAGSQPAINLLVIETEKKKDWGTVFARLQLVSVLGMILALLFGILWIVLFGLQSYLVVCLGFGILATLIAQVFISEPPIRFESDMISKFPSTLIHRIRSNPVILPKLPSLKEVDTLLKMLKVSILQAFPLFLFSTFLFYASSGMYFTAMIPFLKQSMITDSIIFAVYLTLYLTQAVAFMFSSKFVNQYGEKSATIFSFFPRIAGTALTVFAAVYLTNSYLLLLIVLGFVCLDAAFSIYSTSTSLILFKLLPIKRRGYYLGIFGAMTGVGLLIGSVMSGEISALFGFPATFTLATTFLVLSLLIMRIFNKRTEIITVSDSSQKNL